MKLPQPVAANQSELDTILSTLRVEFTPSEREALALCDACKDYPWRTVRSKVNGARVFIEMDGEWRFPEYAIETEAMLAGRPDWTEKMLEETLNSDTYPFG